MSTTHKFIKRYDYLDGILFATCRIDNCNVSSTHWSKVDDTFELKNLTNFTIIVIIILTAIIIGHKRRFSLLHLLRFSEEIDIM